MDNKLDEDGMARVLDAAEILCLDHGNATAEEVAAATGFEPDAVTFALVALAGRGKLLARPGGVFARALKRHIRLPGQSYDTTLNRLPAWRLMGMR